MLSRTAESFFWIGRLIERAEYTARFVNVHYHLLTEIATREDQANIWTRYLEDTGELEAYRSVYGEVLTRPVMEFVTLCRENPNSLTNLIASARNNARGIQDQLSSEVWHFMNDFYLNLKGKTELDLWADTYDVLGHVRNTCYTLDGVMGSTMVHDEGWNFYRLGKNIERGGRTARLIDIPVLSDPTTEPRRISEYHQCLAALKSASAFEAYRKFYSAQLVPKKIVQFLLFHNKFPRSVRFTTTQTTKLVERLAGSTRRPETRQAIRLAGALAADLEFGSLEEVYSTGLSIFLGQVLEQLDQLSNFVALAFFRTSGYSTSSQSQVG
ncbi:MAG: alpha-E domain-containing protein [Nitrospirales bacterium]|nr:alpha-E domain-containing protein [Nitrospira sp.]MDR4489077.1 alpha-E domain-containing protein [Nitrospirales bacterium]